MKVLFLTPSFLPNVGGVERHIAAVSEELAKKGYEVAIITGSDKKPAAWNFGTVTCLPPFRGPFRVFQLWGWFWQNRRLWQEADIVHGHDFPTYYWTAFLRLLIPRPFYLTFHGWEGKVPPGWEIVALRRWAEWGSKGTIAAGHFIAKWYGQHPNLYTYGGVSAKKAARHRKDPTRAVFVGQLREDTGIREYLHAFAQLSQKKLLTAFDIFGEGPLRAELEAWAREHHLAAAFHGASRNPLSSFAPARFAFVSGYLGMLEALATGSIVIATYANPLKEDYLKLSPFHAFIKEAATPDQITDAIIAIQEHPVMARELSNAARKFATKQTWQRVAETYEQLWHTSKLA